MIYVGWYVWGSGPAHLPSGHGFIKLRALCAQRIVGIKPLLRAAPGSVRINSQGPGPSSIGPGPRRPYMPAYRVPKTGSEDPNAKTFAEV